MKKRKNGILHIFAATAVVIIVTTGIGCATTINHSHPSGGIMNNVSELPLKDFEPIGIVFVEATEIIDSRRNHTGSKITHEMFMREAARLGAHDVINIRIDVNRRVERQGIWLIVRTYTYTGTGLAIRFTDAIILSEEINARTIPPSSIVTSLTVPSATPRIVGSERTSRLSIFGGLRLGELIAPSFGVNYESEINESFSLGGNIFFSDEGLDFGLSATGRFYPIDFPFFIELGLGFGAMEEFGNSEFHDPWWGQGHTIEWRQNIGLLITPAIGVRFGGQTGGLFASPYIALPMVLGSEGFSSRFVAGVNVGMAW
ncbi:MAG: hypothetical protein FWC97_11215 [Treponema sp.]|nr:hypothetical protein [Treponema sp.]